MSDLYLNGKYWENNPGWHQEDSLWKANAVIKLLKINNIKPRSVADIGCGVGRILHHLQNSYDKNCHYTGYDICDTAIEKCKEIENDKLSFTKINDIKECSTSHYDVMLCLDVVEHIENYLLFLREIKPLAEYKVFHVPLELSVNQVLRIHKVLGQRKKFGHLHCFTKELYLQSLVDSGYEISDYVYTGHAVELAQTLNNKIFKFVRRFLFALNNDIAVRIMGGYSLLVLTK